jgi:hypothetical protein
MRSRLNQFTRQSKVKAKAVNDIDVHFSNCSEKFHREAFIMKSKDLATNAFIGHASVLLSRTAKHFLMTSSITTSSYAILPMRLNTSLMDL